MTSVHRQAKTPHTEQKLQSVINTETKKTKMQFVSPTLKFAYWNRAFMYHACHASYAS